MLLFTKLLETLSTSYIITGFERKIVGNYNVNTVGMESFIHTGLVVRRLSPMIIRPIKRGFLTSDFETRILIDQLRQNVQSQKKDLINKKTEVTEPSLSELKFKSLNL